MHFLVSIFKFFPYGGLQKDALRFASEAAKRGHSVDMMVTSWEGDYPAPENIHIHFTPKIRSWSNTGRMDEFSRQVNEHCQKEKYDAHLAMNRIDGADFYFAGDSCMKKYLAQQHHRLVLALSTRYRAILRQEAAIFGPQSNTKVFLIAESQRKDYTSEYPLVHDRLIMLPPGIDEACLPPPPEQAERQRLKVRAELELQPDDIMFLLVGTSLHRKGADRAVAAIAALPEQLRKRCRFFIIGNNPSEKLVEIAKNIGLPHGLATALPPRNDVADLLLAADLMIHPAREEGTGTVLVEALANFLPVVCTEACGFSPYVAEAGCPVIPEPFDQNVLNREVMKMLPELPAMRKNIQLYAASCDFCGRSAVAIDAMEEFVRGKGSI